MTIIAGAARAEEWGAVTYVFRETTADETIVWDATLRDTGTGYALTKRYGRCIETILYDRHFQTTSYQMAGAGSQYKINAVRQGSEIVVAAPNGIMRFPLNNLAWIQMALAHRDFILSGEMKREYGILSSSCSFIEDETKEPSLNFIHLSAKKTAVEKKMIAGRNYDAWRVIIKPSGFRGLFWQATYWYRVSDGILLGFEEVRGGPGTPKTQCVLIREETVADRG